MVICDMQTTVGLLTPVVLSELRAKPDSRSLDETLKLH